MSTYSNYSRIAIYTAKSVTWQLKRVWAQQTYLKWTSFLYKHTTFYQQKIIFIYLY